MQHELNRAPIPHPDKVYSLIFFQKYDTMPGKNPIFIIMYKDLIKDPIYWMRRTYQYYEIEWTEQTEQSEFHLTKILN